MEPRKGMRMQRRIFGSPDHQGSLSLTPGGDAKGRRWKAGGSQGLARRKTSIIWAELGLPPPLGNFQVPKTPDRGEEKKRSFWVS